VSAERLALAARLRAWLTEEEFSGGEKVGSERQVAELLGVPRSSLRAALAVLEADGTIYRSMGRSGGIFVPSRRVERQLDTVEGVPAMLRRQGMVASTKVIEFTITTASHLEARNLGIAEDARVYHLVRLREADGVPLSLDSATLPAALLPRFMECDLTGSLYAVLAAQYDQRPVEAHEAIDVVPATEQQAEVLAIEPGDPVLSIWRVTENQFGVPIELAHDIFRADRTRIQTNRHGGRWKSLARPSAMREPRRRDEGPAELRSPQAPSS
jgi:GntR family transcriptional regulator